MLLASRTEVFLSKHFSLYRLMKSFGMYKCQMGTFTFGWSLGFPSVRAQKESHQQFINTPWEKQLQWHGCAGPTLILHCCLNPKFKSSKLCVDVITSRSIYLNYLKCLLLWMPQSHYKTWVLASQTRIYDLYCTQQDKSGLHSQYIFLWSNLLLKKDGVGILCISFTA